MSSGAGAGSRKKIPGAGAAQKQAMLQNPGAQALYLCFFVEFFSCLGGLGSK